MCGRRVRVELSTGRSRSRGFSGPSRRGRPFHPEDRCYECGSRGHYARDCPLYSRGRRRYFSLYLFIVSFTTFKSNVLSVRSDLVKSNVRVNVQVQCAANHIFWLNLFVAFFSCAMIVVFHFKCIINLLPNSNGCLILRYGLKFTEVDCREMSQLFTKQY